MGEASAMAAETVLPMLSQNKSQKAIMSEAMLDAKRARLKVENDREALANRISRLQMEQVRATKRIETTLRRTQEIIAAKDRHQHQRSEKEHMREEQEQRVDEHRQELKKLNEERNQFNIYVKQQKALELQTRMRANKESHSRNQEAIAHQRASELNHAMYKRNEVRRVEADARERKLREKELMIAHLQQRGAERHEGEKLRAEQLDYHLADLERQEYELLVALEGHKSERLNVHRELEQQLGPGAAKYAVSQQPGGSAKAPLA